LAYDKAVIFCYQNKLKDDQTTNYRIDSCEWGWLANDDELSNHIIGGETQYCSVLQPLEAIERYEKKKDQIDKIKISKLKYYKEHGEKTQKLFDLYFYYKVKQDFDNYQSHMYDRRLVNVTFEKYFWESGLN
jgi:hypothetical protein